MLTFTQALSDMRDTVWWKKSWQSKEDFKRKNIKWLMEISWKKIQNYHFNLKVHRRICVVTGWRKFRLLACLSQIDDSWPFGPSQRPVPFPVDGNIRSKRFLVIHREHSKNVSLFADSERLTSHVLVGSLGSDFPRRFDRTKPLLSWPCTCWLGLGSSTGFGMA